MEKKIRPATGIKIKSKKEEISHPKKVIPNVNTPIQEIEPPTEESARVLGQLQEYKNRLLKSMKDFGALMKVSKLPENKSEEEKKIEQNVIMELLSAAASVETLSPMEGALGVAVFAVRQSLSLRDAGNKLAYEVYQLEQRIKKIEGKND